MKQKLFNFQILLFLLFITSCNTGKLNAPENPCPLPQRVPPQRVGLALVLGGGGAKGMSHVGVLEEFQRADIPIDVIVGCSAGSIIGALYADCPCAHHVKHLLRPLRVWDVLDINLWYARFGLVRGRSLRRFLHQHLSCRYFEDLKIPLYIVSTDILAGESVCFSAGPLIPAVHASAAIPLVFSPVYLHERWCVDGGVSDPIPVKVAKQLGAEVIVAVDLSGLLPDTCPTSLFGVASRSAEIKFQLQSESCGEGADVIISPELGNMGLFDDKNPEQVYQAGRKAARESIPKILRLLHEKGLYPVPHSATIGLRCVRPCACCCPK